MAVNDEIFKNLAQYGGGTINERVYNFLGSLGYTGTINDRLGQFEEGGRKGWQGLIRAWGKYTPAQVFSQGQQGVWYEPKPIVAGQQVLYQDSAGTTPVTADGDPVGRGDDLSGNSIPFLAPTSAARPLYNETLNALTLDKVDDQITIDFGGAFAGTVWIKTPNGVLKYEISVDGVWNIPVDAAYLHDNNLGPLIATEGSVTEPRVEDYMGGGEKFSSVTSMSSWFRKRTDVTAIKSSDWNTSQVTDFSFFALLASSLTSLDVSNWNTSQVTTFRDFIYNTDLTDLDVSNWNTSQVTTFRTFAYTANLLTTVTVNGGTGSPFSDSPCTNYELAFSNTNLSQQSIDDILVAIEIAGTSNGTFDQSGGSAPSATGNAAIDALRARGWAITVTGGY